MQLNDLKNSLTDSNPTVRKNTLVKIAELAKEKEFDETLFSPLTKMLDDENDEVQSAASLALFWMAHHGVTAENEIPALMKHLESPDGMIRHDMAGIFESFAQRDVTNAATIPLLENNLDHENPDTRAATIYCLGILRDKGVADSGMNEKLKKYLDDSDEVVRKAATRVLN